MDHFTNQEVEVRIPFEEKFFFFNSSTWGLSTSGNDVFPKKGEYGIFDFYGNLFQVIRVSFTLSNMPDIREKFQVSLEEKDNGKKIPFRKL